MCGRRRAQVDGGRAPARPARLHLRDRRRAGARRRDRLADRRWQPGEHTIHEQIARCRRARAAARALRRAPRGARAVAHRPRGLAPAARARRRRRGRRAARRAGHGHAAADRQRRVRRRSRRSPDCPRCAPTTCGRRASRRPPRSPRTAHARLAPGDCVAVGDSREDLLVAGTVGTFWLVANALSTTRRSRMRRLPGQRPRRRGLARRRGLRGGRDDARRAPLTARGWSARRTRSPPESAPRGASSCCGRGARHGERHPAASRHARLGRLRPPHARDPRCRAPRRRRRRAATAGRRLASRRRHRRRRCAVRRGRRPRRRPARRFGRALRLPPSAAVATASRSGACWSCCRGRGAQRAGARCAPTSRRGAMRSVVLARRCPARSSSCSPRAARWAGSARGVTPTRWCSATIVRDPGSSR